MANTGDCIWYASERQGLKPAGEPRSGMVRQVYADGELLVLDTEANRLVKVWSEHTGPTRDYIALKIARAAGLAVATAPPVGVSNPRPQGAQLALF